MSDTNQFWRLPRVIEETGLSKSKIYDLIKQDAFPAPNKYPNGSGVFWQSQKIAEWKVSVLEMALLG